MKVLYERPQAFLDTVSHYCAGCGHGVVHRLIAEIIDEQDLRERAIGVAPVGCAVLAYNYIDIDWSEAAHGRTPAVATGIKRVHPEALVFTYQGDGDLAAIGTAEIIHAANRGEHFSVIFINNLTYGMTGGQMAPTTLVAQKTATTPRGRNPANEGYPIRVCELLSGLKGSAYLERVSLRSPAHIRKAKKAIQKAFQTQEEKRGFSLVEVLSPCPTYWRMSPVEATKYMEEVMEKEFPLGVFRDWKMERS
jgi:2-oxoglutarate ferredoxin oxidoreductase subunit beta